MGEEPQRGGEGYEPKLAFALSFKLLAFSYLPPSSRRGAPHSFHVPFVLPFLQRFPLVARIFATADAEAHLHAAF